MSCLQALEFVFEVLAFPEKNLIATSTFSRGEHSVNYALTVTGCSHRYHKHSQNTTHSHHALCTYMQQGTKTN